MNAARNSTKARAVLTAIVIFIVFTSVVFDTVDRFA